MCRCLQVLAYITTSLRALAEQLTNAPSVFRCLGMLDAHAAEETLSVAIGRVCRSDIFVLEDVLHMVLMALQS